MDKNKNKGKGSDTEKKKNPHEGHRQRLREKVDLDPELNIMHDHELLELLLSFVIPRKDTNVIAHDLIDKFGSLDSVFMATPKELLTIKNMTVSAAYLVATQLPIARRAMRSVDKALKDRENYSVLEALDHMHSYFYARKTECFVFSVFDGNYKCIKTFKQEGTQASDIVVYTSDILMSALREGAAYVIVAHNHPGGNLSPSDEDIMLTHQIFDALANMNIQLSDHVIFTHTAFFSFNNNGLIEMFKHEFEQREMRRFSEDPLMRQRLRLMLDEYVLIPSKLAEFPYEVVNVKDYSNVYKQRMMRTEDVFGPDDDE